jgi:DNA-binding winged helix-turn-helix (wHTH) protein/pimeloyl-ACP methyl ester carboxylesterase
MTFLFEDFSLDIPSRELRRGAERIALEPQVFDLLVYLIENRDRVVSRDDLIASVWAGRIVSESTLASRINAVRQAIDDDGHAQRLIRTVMRKGVRFVGEVGLASASPRSPAPEREPRRPPSSGAETTQSVTFCRTKDGVHLAVACTGGGPPLVKAANWLTHIEFDRESPVWSPFIDMLSGHSRLVRYDARGNGLSDWDVEDISFETFVRDLESVVDAAGLERFALLGMSQGAAVSIAYATRHPERVSKLILIGGFAQGWRRIGNKDEIAQREALEGLIRLGWGRGNPAFRQVFTSLFIPGGTPEQMRWFNDLQRISTSPDNALRIFRALADIDVAPLLSRVQAPTLVLHSRGDARVPFSQGLALAHGIPDARFVALDSDNHVVLSHEPAWQRLSSEIRTFLA